MMAGVLLVSTLGVPVLPVLPVQTAQAASTTYRDYDAAGQFIGDVAIPASITQITSATTVLDEAVTSGWYYVEGAVTCNPLTVTGDVHLILMDGCALTVAAASGTGPAGICVEGTDSLTIYAQSDDPVLMGSLRASAAYGAGIGGIGYAT